MDFIYEYEFADGTKIDTLNILSESSIYALENIHGKGKMKRITKIHIDYMSYEEDV